MKLLLAIDGSSFSGPPLRATLSRPWPPGASVRVLSVVETLYPIGPEAALATSVVEAQQALRKDAEAAVENARAELAQSGLSADTRVREGNAGQQIVDEATEWGADLVLVGSHGRTGLKRILMGSVAQHVVSHAPCSVEVVRATEAESSAGA